MVNSTRTTKRINEMTWHDMTWHDMIMEPRANSTWNPTSKTDLINILQKCPRCFKSTYNGEFIIPLTDLLYLPKKKLRDNKITNIIINFQSHWCLIAIFWRQRSLILCDSLNTISNNTKVMKYISEFSQKHNLKTFNFSANFQTLTSSKCGQLCLALITILNKSGPKKLFRNFKSV